MQLRNIAFERDLEFCYKKLAEELFELGEIVMKQINKPVGSKERIPHLIEELGDVILNIKILSTKLNINKKVKERVCDKLKTLL